MHTRKKDAVVLVDGPELYQAYAEPMPDPRADPGFGRTTLYNLPDLFAQCDEG